MNAPDEWELRYYQTPGWRVPFRDWWDALNDPLAVSAIRERLDRLRRGLFGDCEPVGEGVLEFRIDLGPGYRGYFYRSGQTVMLLLCGGDKSTQGRDIARAKAYRRDHEKRTRTSVNSG